MGNTSNWHVSQKPKKYSLKWEILISLSFLCMDLEVQLHILELTPAIPKVIYNSICYDYV